jgi:hypothetical protein
VPPLLVFAIKERKILMDKIIHKSNKSKYYDINNMLSCGSVKVIIGEHDFGKKWKESKLKNILDKKG